jgi:putative restriction endonuclease
MATFTDTVNQAEEGDKSALRGLQAWQYLIAKAHTRTIIRYKELQELMEYPTSNPLRHALGCIAFYCRQKNLPALSSIVVNESGVPGEGFFEEVLANIDAAWQQVFDYPWYRWVPPTVEELRAAYVNRGA